MSNNTKIQTTVVEGRPLVSVAMLSYNHGRFIRRAVESAVAQVATFEWEIVIGDDCSTDDTRNVLIQMESQYPDRIRLLFHDRNIGMARNVVETLSACRGRYIALLEGDDYWLGTQKIKAQAEFLETHPEFVSVHHNVFHETETDQATGRSVVREIRHTRPAGTLTISDLMSTNPISTCSVMFRGGLYSLPEWFCEVPTPDWVIHILNARYGKIGYIDEIWGVYRLHSASYWSSLPRLSHLEGQIKSANLVMESLNSKLRQRLTETVRRWHEESLEILLCNHRYSEAQEMFDRKLISRAVFRRLTLFSEAIQLERKNQRSKAARQLVLTLWVAPGRTRIRSTDVLLALFRVVFPGSYRWVRSLWRKQRGLFSRPVTPTLADSPSESLDFSFDSTSSRLSSTSDSQITGDTQK